MNILLALLHLMDKNSANVVKEAIYTMLLWHLGLNQIQVAKRLICFAVDGVVVFEGCRNSVIWQLKEYVAPFVLGVHSVVHWANLVVELLS